MTGSSDGSLLAIACEPACSLATRYGSTVGRKAGMIRYTASFIHGDRRF